MKKSLLKFAALILAVAFSTSSCVDNAYDLSDVNTDDLVIGTGGFVVPLGDIEIDVAQFIEDYNPASDMASKAPQQYKFAPYSDKIKIDAGFDEGLIKQLTEYGEIKVNATASNIDVFGFNLDIKVDFTDSQNNTINIINDKNVSTSKGSVNLTTKTLDKDMLTQIANSEYVKLNIAPSGGGTETFTYDLDQAQKVKIRLTITKTGGIKL